MEKHKKIIEALKAKLEAETGEVELRETHISTVLISGEFVYKVKKPVDMGFLNFTTPESRLLFCRREVTLNRRLSPEVYLGLFPIYIQGSTLKIGEEPLSLDETANGAQADEWLVKMKRLPEELVFRALLQSGKLNMQTVDALAELLAEFHLRSAVPPESEWGKPEAFEFNMNENFEQIKPFVGVIFDAEAYREVAEKSRASFAEIVPHIARRREEGRLVDGHGDLHLEHIYATKPLSVVDCLEFAERFRIADAASDLAFLNMDFDKNGAPVHGHRLVRHYASFSDDIDIFCLLFAYKAYLAVVRAKIHAITSSQREEPEPKAEHTRLAREYLDLARAYLAKPPAPPSVVLVGGIIGSGKSTLSNVYADAHKGVVLSSDIVRKRIMGLNPYERREVPLESDIYSAEASEKTYAALEERAKKLLQAGITPIIDAGFGKKEYRTRFVKLAQRQNVEAIFFYTNCEKEETLKRLENRSASSHRVTDGRAELYDALASRYQIPTADEGLKVIDADTTRNSPEEIIGKLGNAVQKSHTR